MNNIEDTAAAIRIMESGGDYRHQQGVRVDGTNQRKVGAYGIIESRMQPLTEALGIPNADWRDRAVQDAIANESLERSYRELDSWDLAAIAFRFGMPLARHLKEQGKTEPKDIELAGYEPVGRYLRDLRTHRPNQDEPILGKMTTPDVASPVLNSPDDSNLTPNRQRSEEIVRNRIVSMRNAERNRPPAVEEQS